MGDNGDDTVDGSAHTTLELIVQRVLYLEPMMVPYDCLMDFFHLEVMMVAGTMPKTVAGT